MHSFKVFGVISNFMEIMALGYKFFDTFLQCSYIFEPVALHIFQYFSFQERFIGSSDKSFLSGTSDTIWWSFVTMTTVG